MTREEAKTKLDYIRDNYGLTEAQIKAIDMGIEALSAPTDGDLISRQEAMAYPLSWEHYDMEHGDSKFICGVESYREYIGHLPSADRPKGKWVILKEPEQQYGEISFKCPVCNIPYSMPHRKGSTVMWNFCPLCGASMSGGDDDG